MAAASIAASLAVSAGVGRRGRRGRAFIALGVDAGGGTISVGRLGVRRPARDRRSSSAAGAGGRYEGDALGWGSGGGGKLAAGGGGGGVLVTDRGGRQLAVFSCAGRGQSSIGGGGRSGKSGAMHGSSVWTAGAGGRMVLGFFRGTAGAAASRSFAHDGRGAMTLSGRAAGRGVRSRDAAGCAS